MKLRIIAESLEDQVKRLVDMGYEIVEKAYVYPYNMLLIKSPAGNFDIALTTGEEYFLTYDSQKTRSPQSQQNWLEIGRMLANIVKEWLAKYGQLSVGSFNRERSYKYHRLLKRLGFNIGEIKLNEHDDFPDSWDFNIYP